MSAPAKGEQAMTTVNNRNVSIPSGKGEDPKQKGLLNRSRRILVCWEKKAENYLAFLHLDCAQLLFSKLLDFG